MIGPQINFCQEIGAAITVAVNADVTATVITVLCPLDDEKHRKPGKRVITRVITNHINK